MRKDIEFTDAQARGTAAGRTSKGAHRADEQDLPILVLVTLAIIAIFAVAAVMQLI